MGQSSSGASCCANAKGGEAVPVVEQVDKDAEAPAVAAFPPPGKVVKVGVIGARGVRNADWAPGSGSNAGKSDPYCIVEVPGKPRAKFKTAVCADTLDPVWNHSVTVPEFEPGDRLVFTILDSDNGKSDDHLGRAQLTSARLRDLSHFDGEIPLAGEGAKEGSFLVVKVTLEDRPADGSPTNGKSKGDQSFKPGLAKDETAEFKAAPAPFKVGEIMLNPGDNSFGVNLRRPAQKNILIVNGINEGSVWQAWNKGQKEDNQLKPGDRVIQVNNENGNAKELFDEMAMSKAREEKKVFMMVQRPAENRIVITKDVSQSLGLGLASSQDEGFFINEVQESGIIATQWNAQVEDAQTRVSEGDKLVCVNGVRGNNQGLLDEMNSQKSTKKVMTFMTHYEPDAPRQSSR